MDSPFTILTESDGHAEFNGQGFTGDRYFHAPDLRFATADDPMCAFPTAQDS